MTRLLLGALALLLAVPAQAQWVEDLNPSPSATDAEEPPPAEGIQIHSRWTITVRDAHGSVVQERQFQNALLPVGASLLTQLLLGIKTARAIQIEIGGTGGPCLSENGGQLNCSIREADDPYEPSTGSEVFQTLTASPLRLDPNGDTLDGVLLVGSATAARDGAIASVWTRVSIPLNGSSSFDRPPLTRKDLDTPIAVSAGQTVDVRVEITFE